MQRLLLLLTVLAQLSAMSCTLLDKVPRDRVSTIDRAEHLANLNGDYRIFSTDTSHVTLNWAMLRNSRFDFYNRPDSNDWVRLTFIDPRRLEIRFFVDGKLAKRDIQKGKFVDRHFELKPIVKVPVCLIVFNILGIQKTRIGLSQDNNLIVDTSGGGFLLLGLFPLLSGGDANYGLAYARK
jgi:hypothetical protein